jgi:hypothetical protein
MVECVVLFTCIRTRHRHPSRKRTPDVSIPRFIFRGRGVIIFFDVTFTF